MFDEEEEETYYLIESFVCLNACNEREEETEGDVAFFFSPSRVNIIVIILLK